jgi:hypothetical protein
MDNCFTQTKEALLSRSSSLTGTSLRVASVVFATGALGRRAGRTLEWLPGAGSHGGAGRTSGGSPCGPACWRRPYGGPGGNP